MTSEQAAELYGDTAAELLRRWDGGRSVWSIELGGLGPGYEQAIQVLAVELVRDNLGKVPENPGAEWGNETVNRVNDSCGGFSGAQVGAAKWLAFQWLKTGPADLIRRAKEKAEAENSDAQTIQVSNFWPRVKAEEK